MNAINVALSTWKDPSIARPGNSHSIHSTAQKPAMGKMHAPTYASSEQHTAILNPPLRSCWHHRMICWYHRSFTWDPNIQPLESNAQTCGAYEPCEMIFCLGHVTNGGATHKNPRSLLQKPRIEKIALLSKICLLCPRWQPTLARSAFFPAQHLGYSKSLPTRIQDAYLRV